MTFVNIIDARPDTPVSLYGLEKLITQPDPREVRMSEIEAKLAEIETQLKELQKIATVMDKIHHLEAQLKSLQAMVVALYEKLNSTPQTPQTNHSTNGSTDHNTNGAKVEEMTPAKSVEPTPEPPTTDVKEMLKRLMPTQEEIERMVLRVLYKKVSYWHGRADLKVDERGYAVIGRDVNFGVKFSRFVAIMTKYGLSDYVIARGNDSAGYYVEIKASELGTVLRHLKNLDETLKGAITKPLP
jgi:spore cortex formation protein SpoVR/YcgB (stage V sporulation)